MNRLLAILCLAAAVQGCAAAGRTNCPQTASAASFILISDVDDTVKITNVPSFFASVKNALSSRQVFAGMPELYLGLLGETDPGRLEFLSGSPAVLRGKLTRSLDGAGFLRYRLALRANPVRGTGRFKSECLGAMHGAARNQYILIGDDTQQDPEVYDGFGSKLGEGDVLAVYIRRVTGRAIEVGKKDHFSVFTTAYDVALREHRAGRLTVEQAAAVGEAVLTAPDATFLPNFQKCPEDFAPMPDLPERLALLADLTDRRMKTLCAIRRAKRR
jgi:phosphatidate phosphatase APP1